MKFKHSEVQDLLEPQADLYFNALEHERLEEVKHIQEALSVVRNLGEEKVKKVTKLLDEVYALAQDEIELLNRLLNKKVRGETFIPYSAIQTFNSLPTERTNYIDKYLKEEVDKLSEKNGTAF